MKEWKQKLKNKIKPYMTWKMGLVFGTVWIITTGWAHVFVIVGLALNIDWMLSVGTTAEIIIWNPLVSEKLITIPFAIWLYSKIFKEEIEIIREEQEKLLEKVKRWLKKK